MQIIEPDNWCPLAGIELESDASRAIRTEGNVLVVAGPGSGKTELLAQKADYLLRTNLCPPPKKILAISFKKDAAKNLKERIVNRSGKDLAIRIDSLTYDAFAKQLLDQFREVLPKSIRPDQDYVILTNTNQIKQMLQETEYLKFWNTDLHQAEKTLLNNIIKAIKKERIILPEKIYKQIFHREIKPYTNLTFSLITLLVIYILHHNTYILRALRHTYKYVFLDEFQDTTDLQYNLVKKSFCNSSTQVTAVGDNKQRIMLWAGARETVFQDFERDFSARTLYLLMNHRSAPKLVALQKSMYQSLCDDGERNIETSSKWKANDGKVSLWIFNDEKDEAYHLAKNIVEKIKNGVVEKDICILCKQTADKFADEIIKSLKKYNVEARVENIYQDLLKEPIVEIITNFLELAAYGRNAELWDKLLEQLCILQKIEDEKSYFQIQRDMNQYLIELRQKILAKVDIKKLSDSIIGFVGEGNIRSNYPEYNHGNYLTEIKDKFIKLFIDELQKQDNVLRALQNFRGENTIPIMTIHKSKGLEYRIVYFVGLEDETFWNFSKHKQEDRCAFFVALSRAKEEVVFTSCLLRHNMRDLTRSRRKIREFFDLLMQCRGIEYINFSSEKLLSTVDSPKHQ